VGETVARTLLRIEGLETHYGSDGAVVRAVDGVSFDVASRETLAIVGESGSGKSVTALSILRLISPPGRIVGGSILYNGRDLLAMPEQELRAIRGRDIAMIFQEPMTSLDPVMTCGRQIGEAIIHGVRGARERLTRRQARARAIELLELVGIPAAAERVDSYPHQLSGGMRQRVMIAAALACRPSILIADEPTTALDVTIQAQILELLKRLQAELDMAIVLITHDLGLVAEVADRVAVMYAGQVVEVCDVRTAFRRSLHPYTAALRASLPTLGRPRDRLRVIPGAVPSPARFPTGCRFRPRCPVALERCHDEPGLVEIEPSHLSRCFRAEEIAQGFVNPVPAETVP
jgi:oligopeptide/dipeptide ABC transporter ATP-binding protein